MKKWEIFERECTKYINDIYSNDFNITAEMKGGSDSFSNDIQIFKNSSLILNIEAKANNAQSGQFVVSIDTNNIFTYSDKNYSPLNGYTDLIINKLNVSDDYLESSVKTMEIKLPKSVSMGWIKEYYKSKGVDYFISEYKGQKIIVNLANLHKYFSVVCHIRPKTSGSANVSPTMKNKFYLGINKIHPEYNITEEQLYYDGKMLFIRSEKNLFNETVEKKMFNLDGKVYRFQIEKIENGLYYIRKLSTTRNPTVIFSINSILEQQVEDLNSFKYDLKNY